MCDWSEQVEAQEWKELVMETVTVYKKSTGQSKT